MIIPRDEYPPDHRVTPNFTWGEFTCSCKKCIDQHVDWHLFDKLEELRKALGDKAITITSGYRCPDHNAAVGGAPKSRHMLGDAADIKVKNRKPEEVAIAAQMLGFTGIKAYSSWTHVDLRSGQPWFDFKGANHE